jgi:hypothetical protein
MNASAANTTLPITLPVGVKGRRDRLEPTGLEGLINGPSAPVAANTEYTVVVDWTVSGTSRAR